MINSLKLKCSKHFTSIITLMLLLSNTVFSQDLVADNMLMFQRAYGGWPKHYEEKALNYNRAYTAVEKATIVDEIGRNDATIDNDATTKEIWYLVKAYKQFNNKKYLTAAENGIRYLLKAQYENGGWPQFYPDTSFYRAEITFNDNAIVNVLRLLQDIVLQKNDLDVVSNSFIQPSANAIAKGIDCIIKTQVKVNGKLTVWCAQYNQITLQPAKARSFELVSLSGGESVGIVDFLMEQPNPSKAIRDAINAAMDWFNQSKIVGYSFVSVPDAKAPKGKDKMLVKDSNSTIWARFYDIETNKPFFSGRDGIKKFDVKDIEYERRNGYAWYGDWSRKLIYSKYPKWLKKNS